MRKVFNDYEKLKKYIGADGIYSRYADEELSNHLACIGSNTGWFELEIEDNRYYIEPLSYEIGIEEYEYSFILNINMNLIDNYNKKNILKKLLIKYAEIKYMQGSLSINDEENEILKDELIEIENNTFEDIRELIIDLINNRNVKNQLLMNIKLYGKEKEKFGEYTYKGSDNEYDFSEFSFNKYFEKINRIIDEV